PALLRAALRASLRDGLPCRPANEERCGSSTSAASPAGAPRLLGPFSARRGPEGVTGTARCFVVRGGLKAGPCPKRTPLFVSPSLSRHFPRAQRARDERSESRRRGSADERLVAAEHPPAAGRGSLPLSLSSGVDAA